MSLLLDIEYFPRFVSWNQKESAITPPLKGVEVSHEIYPPPSHPLLDADLFRLRLRRDISASGIAEYLP